MIRTLGTNLRERNKPLLEQVGEQEVRAEA